MSIDSAMETKPIRILITDDHSIVRVGTMMIIKDFMPSAVISQADSFTKMAEMIDKEKFDLLILDINMPGGNNFQMIDVVKLKQPEVKILMFSGYDEQLYAKRYLQAGVNGYLHKNASEVEMKTAIESILSKGKYMSQNVKDHLVNDLVSNNKQRENPFELLSNRELEVARFLVKGTTAVEISKALSIQMTTVSTYKTRIFEKLTISNLAELIEKFRLYGISLS